MKGILQKADTLNQNGRIYPLQVLEREVRNYQKFILENRAVGELDHPDSSVVNLKNVSHVIREAYLEGPTVMGTIEVLGKIGDPYALNALKDLLQDENGAIRKEAVKALVALKWEPVGEGASRDRDARGVH